MAQTPIRVSVVIPTRNRHALLEQAVRSVVAQTYSNIEILIIDDGSDPPVVLGQEYPRVLRVVRLSQSAGPAGARNVGIQQATGEIVAFLDDDDVFLPDKLATITRLFEDHPEVEVVAHRMGTSTGQHHSSSTFLVVDDPISYLLHRQPPHVSALAARARALSVVQFDESFPGAADLDFMLRLGLSHPILHVDSTLSLHTQHSEPSLVALETRIAGRQLFRQKHAALFRDRYAEAFHRLRMGHLYRRAGRHAMALREFAASIVHNPADPRAWKGLAMAVLPRSLQPEQLASRSDRALQPGMRTP